MKCAICGGDLDFATVDVANGIKTHLSCFFDEGDIPNVSESTAEERKLAIQKKVDKLVSQHHGEKS